MKKLILTTLVLALISAGASAQAYSEFKMRGGINTQKAVDSDTNFSIYPHLGGMAGLRLYSFGVYAEILWSGHEDANGNGMAGYLAPAAVGRYYTRGSFFFEAGVPYYLLLSKQEPGMEVNPDKKAGFFAGAGVSTRRLELGMRALVAPVSSLQLTASFRFR